MEQKFHLLVQFICVFSYYSCQILDMSSILLQNDAGSFQTYAHEWQIWSHGHLQSHGQFFFIFMKPNTVLDAVSIGPEFNTADEMALFQSPRDLCCYSFFFGICHKFHQGCFPTTHTSSLIRSARSYGSSFRTVSLTGLVLLWTPLQAGSFPYHQINRLEQNPKSKICYFQNQKRY